MKIPSSQTYSGSEEKSRYKNPMGGQRIINYSSAKSKRTSTPHSLTQIKSTTKTISGRAHASQQWTGRRGGIERNPPGMYLATFPISPVRYLLGERAAAGGTKHRCARRARYLATPPRGPTRGGGISKQRSPGTRIVLLLCRPCAREHPTLSLSQRRLRSLSVLLEFSLVTPNCKICCDDPGLGLRSAECTRRLFAGIFSFWFLYTRRSRLRNVVSHGAGRLFLYVRLTLCPIGPPKMLKMPSRD